MASLQHHVVARVLPLLRRNPSADDVERVRRDLIAENQRKRDRPARAAVRGRELTIATGSGFPVFTIETPGVEHRRTLFYVHGGAYVHPSDPAHWRFARRVADAVGARIVLPAYPLAPEATVLDSFDAMVDLLVQAAEQSPDGVVLAGDSAGGGYALALAEALRDRGLPAPTHLVLLAPWVDLTVPEGTAEAARRDPWLSFDLLTVYADFWAGGIDLADPRISPGLGDLAGLPPALMFCGTRDLLQPGCDQLFERADTADWPLEYVVTPDMLHVYPLLPIPEGRTAFDQIVEFLTR